MNVKTFSPAVAFPQWTYIQEQVNKLKVLAIEEEKADPKHTLDSIRTATIAVDKLFSVKNIGHHECFPMFLRLPAGGRKEVWGGSLTGSKSTSIDARA